LWWWSSRREEPEINVCWRAGSVGKTLQDSNIFFVVFYLSVAFLLYSAAK